MAWSSEIQAINGNWEGNKRILFETKEEAESNAQELSASQSGSIGWRAVESIGGEVNYVWEDGKATLIPGKAL